MPSMLGLVLYVLSVFSACILYAYLHYYAWLSPQGLHIENKEDTQVVDTHRGYIPNTSPTYIAYPLYINVVDQLIYSSVKATEDGWAVAIHNLHQKMSNSNREIYTKSQNIFLASPISKMPGALAHKKAAKASLSVQSPLLPIPADRPIKRTENRLVSWINTTTTSSKSIIFYPTIYAGTVDELYGESPYTYMHRFWVCSDQSKTKNIFLTWTLFRDPLVKRLKCYNKGIGLDQVS
jgi:hypothetical protein